VARNGMHRIWWLNAALLIAALLVSTAVFGGPAIAHPLVPWYVLAAAVAACEVWPVRPFPRSAHAFSLTEVPAAMGLIFATGTDYIVGLALGTAAAMILTRWPAVKTAFNLAQYVLANAIGFLVLRAIAGEQPEFGPLTWVGTFVAMQVGGLVSVAAIAAARSLTEGRLTRAQMREMFGLDLVVTPANTSLALLAAVVVIREPGAVAIMIVPLAAAALGYRAYAAQRERSEQAEFLYETNRTLSHSPEVADAIEGLLARARDAFRADHAEIILFSGADGAPVRTRLGPNGERGTMEPVDPAAAAALCARAGDGPVTLNAPLDADLQPLTEGRDIRHLMAAVLHGDDRVAGTVMLANRIGINRGFDGNDLSLFDTLAANAGAALRFDRLDHAVSELQELQRRLDHQAHHDPLTGLANRSLFIDRVGAALTVGGGAAVLFVDLDDFKTVNDTLGHSVGDELLRAVSARLVRAVRREDLVARLGGDEFAVLVRSDDEAAVESVAIDLAERILRNFELPISVGDRLLAVNLSAGVAAGHHSAPSTAELLRDADRAMYEAQSAGKRRYAVFTPQMRDAVMRRHTLSDELRLGIEREELVLQYQPIVDLASGETTAVEALVRWQHPTHGRIPPLEFIPLAENNGLIVPLTRFVLRAACREAVKWEAPIAVQVNLSGSELDDPHLADEILEILASSGLAPERLVIEITETVLVQDAASGSEQLNRLRSHGIKLALDDFGTGFSSLSYLRSLPLDVLKIAKEFTDGIAHDDEDATFVRLIVELAAMRGLTVIAEGVETPAQLDVLQRLNCQLGQGYHFARPLDPDDPFFRARAVTQPG
jgi:diguanylate cyclase (GGDEF)-like protein